jgi:hypothetical protein
VNEKNSEHIIVKKKETEREEKVLHPEESISI